MAHGDPERGGGLSEPLLGGQTRERPAVRALDELKMLFFLAWPVVLSAVCRFLMASTDIAFVGHAAVAAHGGGGLPNGTYVPSTLAYGTHLQGARDLQEVEGMPWGLGSGIAEFWESIRAGGNSTVPHSGQQYLAAAAMATTLQNLLVAPPCSSAQALNTLVSQALGAGNHRLAGVWFQISMIVTALMNLPAIGGFFFTGPILLALGFEEGVCHLAQQYSVWSTFWLIPNGWYQCMRFFFQAQHKPLPALYNNVFFTIVNFLLNWIFVLGVNLTSIGIDFHWAGLGFIGAPISTSVSRCLQPLVYWLYMFVIKREHAKCWPGVNSGELTRARYSEFFGQSLPLVGTFFISSCLSQASTFMVATLGALDVATASGMGGIMLPVAAIASGAGMAVTVRVGHHLGGDSPEGAKMAMNLMLVIMTGVGVVLSVGVYPASGAVARLLSDDPDVRQLGAKIAPLVAINLAVGALNSVGSAVLNGQGRPKVVTLLSFAVNAPLTVGVFATMLFVFHQGLYMLNVGSVCATTINVVVVFGVLSFSKWDELADAAMKRSEVRRGRASAAGGGGDEDSGEGEEGEEGEGGGEGEEGEEAREEGEETSS